MSKKRYWILAIAVLAVAALCVASFALRTRDGEGTYDDLIANGGAESLNVEGMPQDWYTDAYIYQGYSSFDVADGRSGSALHIVNTSPNDARFAQRVSVSPNTLYCLSGYIRASAEGGLGANLSIEGVYVFSESVYDTDGAWKEVRLYGRTGEKQRSVTVYARLGGYSGEATGEAWFDDISLCRVDSVPAGFYETHWYTQTQVEPAPSASAATGARKLILAAALYALACALLCRRIARDTLSPFEKGGWRETLTLAVMLAAGLALRLYVAGAVPGYDVDIGCFQSWAGTMAKSGPLDFYSAASFCDYPPGYLWVLLLIGALGKAMGGISQTLVKSPAILADMALCLMLYSEAKRRSLSSRQALTLCLCYAFNPLTLAAGAAWGQTDGVMTLLIFLVLFFALRGQWKAALPLYVAAVLVKPQSLMFGPLGLAALIMHLIAHHDRKSLRDALLGVLFAVFAGLAIALPFSKGQPWNWLLTLYRGTMGQYDYATVNACNLYFLFGKNWVKIGDSADGWLALTAWLLIVLPVCLAGARYLRYAACRLLGRSAAAPSRETLWQGRITLALCLALGAALLLLRVCGALTLSALSSCMIAFSVLLCLALYALRHDIRQLPLLGAALLCMLYATGGMMHERYLFPAVALLLYAYILQRDRRILLLALGVTITGLFNVGCALDRNIRIGGAAAHLSAPACAIVSDMAALEYIAAAGNCLLCAYAVYLSAVLCRAETKARVFAASTSQASAGGAETKPAHPLPSREPLRKMTKRDWLIMLLTTALYAALAFTNLGSLKAPQNAWTSDSPEEQVTIDLGEARDFRMLYYCGIHWYDDAFTVEISPDGESWNGIFSAAAKQGDCFKWKYLLMYSTDDTPAELSGRYVRITAGSTGLTLFETLFRDAQTGEALPVADVQSSTGNIACAALIDEQDTLEGEPGWYNSTYFDEIYHARTAYEHLHSLRPYETTHPPLGKVLMSFAIAVFGMTPFGWRFAGTLAGVLMLPCMYLLGKLLFKQKWGGLVAMTLLALDLMHFTQTRIATIDSFVVLFIIWSLYFMLRWFMADYFARPFIRSLPPLALSGLFMGLAVASKWTGCYAGVGLAIIFFWGIYRRAREVCAAKAILAEKRGNKAISEEERSACTAVAEQGARSLLLTAASCLIFFVAVPLAIYYLSYVPYFAYSGGVTVQKVIEAAVGTYFTTGQVGGMLGYHAQPGLGMDHFFYSLWYQWPLNLKPMWYASSSYEPAGMQSTIMAMGNPAVWWVGLAALAAVAVLWAKRHVGRDGLRLYAPTDEPRPALLLIWFIAQFLPWILVPRGTYIYHYFPSVPTIILCTMLCLDSMAERCEKAARIALIALLAAALVLFVAFFPYASGVTVPQGWLDAMKWFKNWLWY